ncbi:MAG: hypothetical protein ABL921_29530 [Pirellula sp.]
MYREESTTEARLTELNYTIDPGFVNRRRADTVFGDNFVQVVHQQIQGLPPLPTGLHEVGIDRIYTHAIMSLLKRLEIKTLGESLHERKGHLICSTEEFLACSEVYDSPRVVSEIIPRGNTDHRVFLEYSTSHIRSDTLRSDLHRGATLAFVAEFDRAEGSDVFFRPLVMGGPWLDHEQEDIASWAMWAINDHFENFIEDITEFSRVKEIAKPIDVEPMRAISEFAFKTCLTEIIGDTIKKDWGGEMSDHYTAHIHLLDKRVTGAFLLKGPSDFRPMGLNHLGKNNDQIFRLAQEPADLLVVQHCHEITSPVRETLRVFAVQPGRPRRYCLIDGRDSLWLLHAYNMYERALALSTRP